MCRMRIAVISDVHGNLPALDAVLAAIVDQGVDLVVNCGDLLSGFVDPAGTADRLMTAGFATVAGNHERQVLTFGPDRIGMADRLTRQVLSEDHLRWLRSLPAVLSPAAGVLAFHGTPSDDLQYLLHTVEPGGVRDASVGEVVERLGDVRGFGLLLCGHTHLRGELRLPGGALVVNPGSVGWPAYEDDVPYPHRMQAGSPHAWFAVVDDATGRWEASFHAVEYDWESAAVLAGGFGRADVAAALRTGLVG
jgi:predicted phosphodiesterase